MSEAPILIALGVFGLIVTGAVTALRVITRDLHDDLAQQWEVIKSLVIRIKQLESER